MNNNRFITYDFQDDYLNEINSSAYHLNTTQIQVENTPQSYVSTDLPDLPSKFPPDSETPVFESQLSDTNSFTFDDQSIRSSSPQTCQTQHGDQFSDEGITYRNIESISITTTLNCPKPNDVRTNGQLIAQRVFELPDGIPSGPWLNSDIAKIELNQWAYKFNSGGGCFKLIWGSTLPKASKKGKQKVLLCHCGRKSRHCGEKTQRSTYKCNCPHYIKLEECVEGWGIVGLNIKHNHDFPASHGATLADPQLRHIPEELLEFGRKLKQAGFSGSKISQVLENEAFQRDIRITWTRKDVYNNFASKRGERYLDATNFVEFLQKRYNQNDLFFEVMTDSDGCLVNAFWILIDALHRWSDTSHATNKYGLKFGPLITIDSNGRTIILACSLLTTETEHSFEWVFSTFEKAFHHPPKVIITDRDPTMASAIHKVWSNTVHLLCTFHLAKNLTSHIKPDLL